MKTEIQPNPADIAKIKKFIESNSSEEAKRRIWFDFNTINGWEGYLETHISDGDADLETQLDTKFLKAEGIEIRDSAELREKALEQFKSILNK